MVERLRPSRVRWLVAGALVTVAVTVMWWLSQTANEARLPPFSPDPEATEIWLRVTSGALQAAPCATAAERDRTTDAEEVTVGITIFRGPGVSDALVRRELESLTRVYEPHGVRFVTDDAPRSIPMCEATAAMLEAAVGESLPPASPARRELWRALLSPALEFVHDYGIPPRRAVHVVFVPRIAPARSLVRRLLPHLTGLTFTPTDEGEPGVRALLGVSSFTPTVFLSVEDIRRLPADHVPSTLAHEMGHALGLAHVDDPESVMATGPHDCLPRLSDAQRAALRPL